MIGVVGTIDGRASRGSRSQQVEVQEELGLSAGPKPAPVPLSRAQRAHSRLDFQERFARNARASTAGRVTIRLFGVPESFATSLGFGDGVTPSRQPLASLFSDRLASSSGSSWLFFLAVPQFLPFSVLFALHPAVSAFSHRINIPFCTIFTHQIRRSSSAISLRNSWDSSWQAKAGKGFDLGHFSIDWSKQQATCPQGQTSARMSQAAERMEIVFASETCAACPVRQDCTRSQTTGRVLHLRPQAAHEALQARRLAEQTPEFRQQYALRSGIEGTLSQGVRAMGLRRSRYDGLARTHVQHILTAVAVNLVRIDAVLTNIPRGKTRRSHFAQLASIAAFPVGA